MDINCQLPITFNTDLQYQLFLELEFLFLYYVRITTLWHRDGSMFPKTRNLTKVLSFVVFMVHSLFVVFIGSERGNLILFSLNHKRIRRKLDYQELYIRSIIYEIGISSTNNIFIYKRSYKFLVFAVYLCVAF